MHLYIQDITPGILENELETGKALYKEKKNEEAAEQFRKVMQLARLGTIDRLVEARALGNYATVCRDLKRYNDAILSYRLCCRILRILGERQMVCTVSLSSVCLTLYHTRRGLIIFLSLHCFPTCRKEGC